jgi:hypothetical protein
MVAEFFPSFSRKSTDRNKTNFQKAYDKVVSYLKEQPEIRIYVDGSPNFGHQATTVSLMKRIIDLGLTPDKNKITMVYQNDDALNKLAKLLPDLDPKSPKEITVKYLNKISISFLAYDSMSSQPLINFGLTGGADGGKNIDFAKALQVKNFLRLQPYLWTRLTGVLGGSADQQNAPEQLQLRKRFLGTSMLQLDQQKELQNFLLQGYYLPPPVVEDEEWTVYEGQPDLQVKIQLVKAVLKATQDEKIKLLPIYGVGVEIKKDVESKGNMGLWPSELLFNLTMGILKSQETYPHPVIMMDMATVPKKYLQEFQSFLAEAPTEKEQPWYQQWISAQEDLKKLYKKENPIPIKEIEEIKQKIQGLEIQLNPLERRGDFVRKIRASERVIVQEVSVDDFNRNLQMLQNGSRSVLFIQLGTLPPNIFNYLFSQATLPFVFEGQGTAGLALNLGKPYLKPRGYNARQLEDYPAELLNLSTEEQKLIEFYKDSANAISEYLHIWPEEKNPAEKISDFIERYYVKKDKTIINYFQQVKKHYHNESLENDKLMKALIFMITKKV